MLLDLQVSRYSSLATDLNHILFTSLESSTQRPNMKKYLEVYYQEFVRIVSSSSTPVPFTFEQLLEEFKSKNPYGIFMAIWMIPFLTLSAEDMPDISSNNYDVDVETNIKKKREKLIKLGRVDGPFRSRLLAFINDLIQANKI